MRKSNPLSPMGLVQNNQRNNSNHQRGFLASAGTDATASVNLFSKKNGAANTQQVTRRVDQRSLKDSDKKLNRPSRLGNERHFFSHANLAAEQVRVSTAPTCDLKTESGAIKQISAKKSVDIDKTSKPKFVCNLQRQGTQEP